MGELLDQIMSGGPDLLPLTSTQQSVSDAILAEPDRWAFFVEHKLLPAVSRAIVAAAAAGEVGSGRPPHDEQSLCLDLIELARLDRRPAEEAARFLLAVTRCGPAIRLGSYRVYDAIRAAVLRAANDDRRWEKQRRATLRPGMRWEDSPALLLEAAILDGYMSPDKESTP